MQVFPPLPGPEAPFFREMWLEKGRFFQQLAPSHFFWGGLEASPFLRLTGQRHADYVAQCLQGDARELAETELAQLHRLERRLEHLEQGARADSSPDSIPGSIPEEAASTDPEAPISHQMRVLKERLFLAVSLGDLAGRLSLSEAVGFLSRFADGCCQLALRMAMAAAHPELRPEQFAVLGMGKLGGMELNYASDIDLILLYKPPDQAPDGESGGGGTPPLPHKFAVRAVKNFIATLEEHSASGFLFRVDLRLRPDPSATPPVLNIQNALTYYESFGSSWERAALIRARPVAGSLELGSWFMAQIRDFIWRRYLDYTLFEDVRQLKERIDRQGSGKDPPPPDMPASRLIPALLGWDLKRDRGGIREIEFHVQTLQLLWGGRVASLKEKSTLKALGQLERAGKLTPRVTAQLRQAYVFLRSLEHRLQMQENQQTHQLPKTVAAFEVFALFCGYEAPGTLARELALCLNQVSSLYLETFYKITPGNALKREREEPEDNGQGPNARTLVSREASLASLLGHFADPVQAQKTIALWASGAYRVFRFPRARTRIEHLTPFLLASIVQREHPDAVLRKLDGFFIKVPPIQTLLALLEHHPNLIQRLLDILCFAPGATRALLRRPVLFENLLIPTPVRLGPRIESAGQSASQSTGDMPPESHQEEPFEAWLDRVRLERLDNRFRLEIDLLDRRMELEELMGRETETCEGFLTQICARIHREMVARFGPLPGGRVCLIGLGKLGGRELLPDSDLDLLCLYDAPEGAQSLGGMVVASPGQKTGQKPSQKPGKGKDATHWYSHFVQRLTMALSTPTSVGKLYESDFRLRPYGRDGPLATRLDHFVSYHLEQAWAWERFALLRARPVAGDPSLCAEVETELQRLRPAPIRGQTITWGLIREACLDMRAKISEAFPAQSLWDVKYRRGGLMDIDQILAALVLTHASGHPVVLAPYPRTSYSQASYSLALIRRLAEAGLVTSPQSQSLSAAHQFLGRVQALFRLNQCGPTDPPGESFFQKNFGASRQATAQKVATRTQQVLEVYHSFFEK